MSCYVSSNNNRVYVALEQNYGEVAAITGANRIPLVKLDARQSAERVERRDKTGSRTFVGLPNRIRRHTTFQLTTFMTQWAEPEAQPRQGALFQAALGGTPLVWNGGTVGSLPAPNQIVFNGAHGLRAGQGVRFGDEIRFVAAVSDGTTVILNAPFTTPPVSGAPLGRTVTYPLATELPSASIYDAWDPAETAVQRILNGAAMDGLRVKVNGDFHEFQFAGPAKDLLDNVTFENGQGGLTAFPEEPSSAGFDYTIVPGHLGQAWMGTGPARLWSLTSAELAVENHIALRTREFGSDFARCIAAGTRSVSLKFSMFEEAEEGVSRELYQAARQRSPVAVMLQLGEQAGQLFGAYMPAMIPEVPEFDDEDSRLEWVFGSSRAVGAADDELWIAFG